MCSTQPELFNGRENIGQNGSTLITITYLTDVMNGFAFNTVSVWYLFTGIGFHRSIRGSSGRTDYCRGIGSDAI